MSNSSQSDDNVNCRQLTPNENYNFEITNACEGHFLIQNCPPIFVSIQSVPQESQNNFQCNEVGCRYPDEIKFTITLENLGCYSSSAKIVSKLLVIVFSVSIHLFIKKLTWF